MKIIGVVANCGKPRARDVLGALSIGARRHGMTLLADKAAATLLPGVEGVDFEQMFSRVECVLAVGGDGTMLRAVRELGGRDIPVMGVNVGGLGFLTSVSEPEIDLALECLAGDRVRVSRRSVLAAAVTANGSPSASYRGLNDVVMTCGTSARTITLDVAINGEQVTSYVCDGLIVSTPTGSTGHSMSAGGPIVMPDSGVFVLSLICPHTLSSRPLVVPDAAVLTIRGQAMSGANMNLTVDGQVGQELQSGDTVTVRKAESEARFLHLPGYSHFSVLRQKLNWRGSSVR